MRTQHIARVLLLGTFGIFLTGCQVFSPVGDFISQRYTNTASYFNTYYNAQKMFSDAESEVLEGMKAAREKNAKGQALTFTVPSTARSKFTSSIEKNSKLLTYYPTSTYVDDALLMIGKAYYYLEEDVKAERKFLELIAQYPESGLIPETKLWYGKSLLRQRKTADGLQQLASLYAQAMEEGEENVAGEAALAIGNYHFEQNDYANALKYYTQSIDVLSDDVENARTQFQIGLCYDKLGDAAAAADAFRSVDRFDPDYNTTFQAALYESRMLAQQKKFDEALDILFEKLDDKKYSDYAGTAHREVGNTYAAQGDIEAAVAQYRFVDTAYARTDDAARSMFALASLYEHKLFDYDSARVYYDRARTEFSASEITPSATLKSESFTKYLGLKSDLARYDTLVMDITKPGWRKPDSLTLMRQDSIRRADSASAAMTMLHAPQSAGKDTAAGDAAMMPMAGATVPQDSAQSSQRPQSMQAELSSEQRDSLARIDSTARLTKALHERERLDSLSRQIVRTKFEMAGLLYLEMNRPDSALVYYTDVVAATQDSALAARALYTMADIYRSTDSTSQATVDSLYRVIIAVAPNSSYALEARRSLGMPVEREAADSSEVRYLNGEQLLTEGRAAQAIPVFQTVAREYPKSPYAPKALYTIGWIYENTLSKNDSAEAVYQRLAKGYPASTYAMAVKPKLSEAEAVRREAEEKAKAEQDAKAKAEAEAARQKAEAEKQKAETEQQKTGAGTIAPSQPDSAVAKPAADSAASGPGTDSSTTTMPNDTTSVRPARRAPLPALPDTGSRSR